MLRCESRVEDALRTQVQEKLDKLHVRLHSVHHNELTGTVDVVLGLPQWADRNLRFEVLEHLEQFEEDSGQDILTNPTFVAADD